MAETYQLKDSFDAAVVRGIGRDIAGAYRAFDERAFVRAATRGLTELELTDRARHVTAALREHLPDAFPEAAQILIASLGPLLERTEANGMTPFRYLPHVFYAASYGLDHFEPAMQLQYELTQRFTAEFSVRAYVEKHPEWTLARLREWAADPSVHVRRLVSEGTRPRLPWAPRLRALQADPRPGLALLELLKDDPEQYVRRSVANHLNDIGKDHPDVLVDVCRRWSKGASEERLWITRHALRSLVKAGHPGALGVVGFEGKPAIRLGDVLFEPRRVKVGGKVRFSVEVVSASTKEQNLLVDFVVHFVKARGEPSAKVFKLKKLTLGPRQAASLEGRISFAELTTRKHYPGVHRVELAVNGVRMPLGEVRVLGRPG